MMDIRKIMTFIIQISLLLESTLGFTSVPRIVHSLYTTATTTTTTSTSTHGSSSSTLVYSRLSSSSSSSGEEDNNEWHIKRDEAVDVDEYELVPIQKGEMTDDLIRNKLESAPSQLEIMKELLGINGFTYILAFLIAFFLGMNLILGPGWLGQQLGLEGRGTFTEISNSLPDSVDLSRPEFLLME